MDAPVITQKAVGVKKKETIYSRLVTFQLIAISASQAVMWQIQIQHSTNNKTDANIAHSLC